ncbi:MAG: ABC transporter ATP-binding protein [Eubacteriales bacterium]
MASVLKCEDLTKKYGEKIALDKINLDIPSGGIVGLLGPNGSGKTTLIKLICGLLTANSGSITVDGIPIGVESKKKVAYLPDHMFLSNRMTVAKEIVYFSDFFEDFNPQKAEEMVHALGIDTKATVGSLSKGNKEKVALILTMSRSAKLYLLDEPIAGVDPATRDYILQTIIRNYAEDAAVLISTHLISDIETVLERVIFLQQGHIVLDDETDNIREKYGTSVDAHFREVFKW